LRITAVLRRTNRQAEQADLPTEFAIGNLTFDYRRQMLIGKKAEIKMTTREAELLRLLCLNLNQTLERGRALREIWGDENYFSGRSMDVFISRLRKYFKDDPRVEIISVHGKGFRLVVNP